jgi:2-polyprenyl-3-methyl-5-hydroxy-6-metoxy-1,4-benzoquinol methylase
MLNARWDDRPADYAATRDCWLTQRRTLFVQEALREAPAGARVLELGSGVGELLIALATARPDLTFVGTEPQQSYVDWARRAAADRGLANLTFTTALAEDVGSRFTGSPPFDRILSNDMLHHVPRQEVVLKAAARVTRPGARWLVVEPNWINPYVLIGCAVKRGERNFWPRPFLEEAGPRGWSLDHREYLFLIPPFVRRAPRFLIRIEQAFERYPWIAGGVALTLVRR